MKNNQSKTIIERNQDLRGNSYGKMTGRAAANIHSENKRLQYKLLSPPLKCPIQKIQ